jgi:predicted metal-dependent phosphotriesterase family hydrolase
MSEWLALLYPLKAGSEDAVAEIFRQSGRPDHTVVDADGKEVGRLLRTLVFVGKEKAVRVIEVEGPLPLVSAHMSRQPAVRQFEAEVEEHLAEPRDMITPEGARAFFASAGMQLVMHRTDHDDSED